MAMGIRAVLFDIDDTLFDRNKAQEEILRIIVRELDHAFRGIDEERITKAFAESDRVTTQEYEAGSLSESFYARRSKLFVRMLGLSEDYEEKITALYVTLYPTLEAPVPGAQSVVRNLAARFPLGVVSNGFRDVQHRKLEALGIKHFFQCVVLSEEVGTCKPDRQIFLHAAALLGAEPRRCLHVGDLYDADVIGAKRAGLKACWFNSRGLRVPQSGPKADAEIRAMSELPGLLDAWACPP